MCKSYKLNCNLLKKEQMKITDMMKILLSGEPVNINCIATPVWSKAHMQRLQIKHDNHIADSDLGTWLVIDL